MAPAQKEAADYEFNKDLKFAHPTQISDLFAHLESRGYTVKKFNEDPYGQPASVTYQITKDNDGVGFITDTHRQNPFTKVFEPVTKVQSFDPDLTYAINHFKIPPAPK